jgi:hypothetical protein
MRHRKLLGTTLALVALSASIAGITAGTADAVPNNPCANARASLRGVTLQVNDAHRSGNQSEIQFWRSVVFDEQQAVLAVC